MKTNIIFIIVDTLRADALGIYGNKKNTSPNIDRLAEKGVVFTNAYASTTKTDPSISSIFSGKYPQSVGLISHGPWLSYEEEKNIERTKLLPEILKARGYKTIAFDWLSRWHKRGYDYYSGKIVPDAKAHKLILDRFSYLKYLRKLDRDLLTRLFKRDFFTRLLYSSFTSLPIPYDPADVVVNKAIEYLEETDNKPFFLYLHLWDPHWPYVRPRSWHSFFLDTVVERYLAEVKFTDEHLGRFFKFLEKKNLLNNSLIIFTADHGESLTEHQIFITHKGLYEEVVKVPLFFYHQTFKKEKIKSLVAHVDIFPTILDFLGIKREKQIDGKSLLPLILGQSKKVRDDVFFSDIVFGVFKIKRPKRRRGIRLGDYKYIQSLEVDEKNISQLFIEEGVKIIEEELFNLKLDPQEKVNLAFSKIKEKTDLKSVLENHLKSLYEKYERTKK